jgi:hypothetical protein
VLPGVSHHIPATASENLVFHALLALAAIVALAQLLGALSRACRQPPVIGEIAAKNNPSVSLSALKSWLGIGD